MDEGFNTLASAAPELTQPLEPQPIISQAEAEAMPTADLRAAMEGKPVPPQQPQTAAPDQHWTVGTLPDGRVEVQLDNGGRYLGKSTDEVLQQLAKAQWHSAKRIQELNAFQKEYDTWRSQNADPTTAPQIPTPEPQMSPEEEQQLYNQFAKDAVLSPEIKQQLLQDLQAEVAGNLLGVPPEQAPERIGAISEAVHRFEAHNALNTFRAETPDFIPSVENEQALMKHLQPPEFYAQQHRVPTPQELQQAWAMAVWKGDAKRIEMHSGNPVPPRPVPPAMPASSIGMGAPDSNPWTMPKAELRKLMEEELRKL